MASFRFATRWRGHKRVAPFKPQSPLAGPSAPAPTSQEQRQQLDAITRQLQTGMDHQRSDVAKALYKLLCACQTPSVLHGALVAQHDVVPPLVALLGSTDEKARKHAVYALGQLADVPSLCQAMLTHGAIPALVALLSDDASPSTRAKIVRQAVRALAQLARWHDQAAAAIVVAGGLPRLIPHLRSPSSLLVRRTLEALFCITEDNPDLQQAAATCGLVPQLLALCRPDHVGGNLEAGVQVEALKLLSELCCHPRCAEQVAGRGGVEVIGELMGCKRQQAVPGALQAASRALERIGHVASLPKDARQHLARLQAQHQRQQLLGTVVRGEAWIRSKAERAIELAAAMEPDAFREMQKQGVVERLWRRLLWSGTSDGALVLTPYWFVNKFASP